MGKIVEKKRKKKGRPSLLDIQKRNLRLQKEQQQQNQNTITTPTNPSRRFTRRNPDPDVIAHSDDDDDNEGDESKPNRREKKLNSVNSPYLDLGLYGSDSNEELDETPLKKKRKINALAGSAHQNAAKKGEKQQQQQQNWKGTEKHLSSFSGTPSESGPTGTTSLPDKKLLVFILDRLQKKDTYGVYSEPVDTEELPDYLDIIDTPMDFGTVRKKLEDGAYATLEQFESDVFLISSNAMQYNAPDTIYFRQARTIHELARKDFQNLRQDSDHEQRPKIARRGRPPKKPLGNTSSEREGLDATLAINGDNAGWSNSYNLRRGRVPEKYVYADSSRRTSYGSRNSESYSWLSEHKFEKNDGFSGSSMKGFYSKYGNKQSVLDESSRRNSYITSHPVVGSESSVLSTFDGEVKQLLPVGLHTEHGYARSLARFAANLGPVAWKMASKKIERALPPGTKFGPGWIGDDEAPSVRIFSLATPSKCPMPQEQPISSTQISSAAVPQMVESKEDTLLKQKFMNRGNNLTVDGHPNRAIFPTVAASSTILSRTPELLVEPAETAGRFIDGGFGVMCNGTGGIRAGFQIHDGALVNPAMNGFSCGVGANVSSQMGKAVGPAGQSDSLSSDVSVHSRILEMVSKSNFINTKPSNNSELQRSNVACSSSTINSSSSMMPNCIPEAEGGTGMGLQAEACWDGLLAGSVNTRFQSPGSPNPSARVDSSQPDLALQL